MQIYLENTTQTEKLGADLFEKILEKSIIFLQGDLGVECNMLEEDCINPNWKSK